MYWQCAGQGPGQGLGLLCAYPRYLISAPTLLVSNPLLDPVTAPNRAWDRVRGTVAASASVSPSPSTSPFRLLPLSLPFPLPLPLELELRCSLMRVLCANDIAVKIFLTKMKFLCFQKMIPINMM